MKYFTPELLIRGNSPDDAVVEGVEEDWEQAIRRYNRRWSKIKSAFPAAVRRFDHERVCLHDADLLSMGREGDNFVIVLQPEPPAQTLVVLTFTLDGDPVIDLTALPDREERVKAYWMYEEFDLDRQKRPQFEVLFSNGWSVKLRFRDFHYQIAQRLFPVPKIAAKPTLTPPQTPVSQPA